MSTTSSLPRQARVIPTRRPIWWRIYRELMLRYLRWCEESTRDEREAYQAAGIKMGPDYLRNSYAQEEILRVRIADLENA